MVVLRAARLRLRVVSGPAARQHRLDPVFVPASVHAHPAPRAVVRCPVVKRLTWSATGAAARDVATSRVTTWRVAACSAVLTLSACQKAPPTGERTPPAPASTPSGPPPPWYSGEWSLRALPGTPAATNTPAATQPSATTLTTEGAGSGPSLEGSVRIDEAGQVTGTLRRAGTADSTPLVVRGSLLEESLRFEAASLAERALVAAERSGAGSATRFVGSLVWASIDGAESRRSAIELSHTAPRSPSTVPPSTERAAYPNQDSPAPKSPSNEPGHEAP